MSTRSESGRASSAPRHERSALVAALVFIGLVVAVVGSLGAPLITAVAADYHVSLAAAQWTLTVPLLLGAVSTPILSRLGSGPRRRAVVIWTLTIVAAGGALTALPVPFPVLLIGRAAQGVGLGLTALMMAVAREHLSERRSARAIALLSVASTAGVGVGYPLAGLLTDFAGIRAAYALGFAVATAALIVAVVILPSAPPRPPIRVDVRGAVLLTCALMGLLLVISQTGVWDHHASLAAGVLVISMMLFVGWVVLEARTENPLVDVRALRHPAVASANLAMFAGGIAMYLLLSLVTRYVQTPAATGYGFGLSTFQAGLVLVPFSLFGFVAGRLIPRLHGRFRGRTLLAGSAGVVLVAFVAFAISRDRLVDSVVAISVLGLGVGAFSAAMPAVILAATPPADTAGAMGVNQVVRSVGFSIGSALGGLILAGHTTEVFPDDSGYSVAAWVGAAVTVATLLSVAAFRYSDAYR
ncbi:MFS transporter [Rhodococcus hoagii]|nr:MFS transporter [Prescottella equi]